MKNYTITVNGTAYNVTVQEGANAPAPVSAPAPCFGIRSSDKFIILFIFDPTAIIRTIRQKHRKICVWIRKVRRPVHPAQIKITGMTHTVICL